MANAFRDKSTAIRGVGQSDPPQRELSGEVVISSFD